MFDKNEFVESVITRDLSLYEIANEARAEIARIESRSIRAPGSSDDVRFLGSVEFFVQSREIPANLPDDNFQLVLHLAWYLIGRGDLTPDVLELFGAGAAQVC